MDEGHYRVKEGVRYVMGRKMHPGDVFSAEEWEVSYDLHQGNIERVGPSQQPPIVANNTQKNDMHLSVLES